MKKFPSVSKDKESGLPKKYVAGLSTSTAKARAAHWKKMSNYSDKDPRAYKPAPGDATAKTKPSKYTKRFHKMFGEQIGIVIEGAPEKIEGTNCANCIHWVKESEKPVDKSELNEFGGLKAPNEAYIDMSKHVDLVTLPGKANVKIKAYCDHEDIHDFVTERMCCAYWDGEGVKREFKGVSPKMDESVELDERIVKVDNKFRLVSKKTGRNLGTYDTKAGAMKRERQVQYFKSLGETMKNESKIAGVLAAMNKARPEPKVGDRVVTIKGGQNTGTVEKIKDNHVYFRSDHSQSSLGGGSHKPLYKTHISNVRLHEERKVSFGRSGGVIHYNPKTEKSEKDGTAKLYDPEKHDKKLSPKGGFAQMKKEEVEQMDEASHVAYLKPKANAPSDVKDHFDLPVHSDSKKDAHEKFAKVFGSNMAKHYEVVHVKPKAVKEEVEQIDELKKSTLASYVNKAANQVRAKTGIAASFETQGARKKDPANKAAYMNLAKDYRQGAKQRLTGIEKATTKLAKEETEKVAETLISLKRNYSPTGYMNPGLFVKKQKQKPSWLSRPIETSSEKKKDLKKEETELNERNKDNAEAKKRVIRQAGINAAISGKVPFAGSALQMGRKAAKKLPSKTLAKSYRELPRVAEEAIEEGKADTSLAAKAKKSGISLKTLQTVYKRGHAAWNSGHRPGTTPQQWGHARVNSYITKGKTYHTADKDLRRESVDFNEAFKEEFNDEIE
jgi:hypothetical protein